MILYELVQQKQETHRVYRFSIIADKQAASSSDNSRADLGGSAVAKLLSANGHYDLHMQPKCSRSAGALNLIEHIKCRKSKTPLVKYSVLSTPFLKVCINLGKIPFSLLGLTLSLTLLIQILSP